MNETRWKLGLAMALLAVLASALFWDALYRSAAATARDHERSDRLVLVTSGGPPAAPHRPARLDSEAGSPTPVRQNPPDPVDVVPPPPEPRTYRVRKGDSLYLIADRVLGNPGTWPEIARLNDISAPYEIRPDQVLRLPGASR